MRPHTEASTALRIAPVLGGRRSQVLEALCEGLSEKQVARRLNLSPHTVHGYVKSIYRELGVNSRAELLVAVLKPPGF